MAAFADQAALAWQLATTQRQMRELDVLTDRDRIARDLHDHVIQRLFAVGVDAAGHDPARAFGRGAATADRDASTNCRRSSRRSAPRSSTCTAPSGSTRLRQRLDKAIASFASCGLRTTVQFVGPLSVDRAALADHAEAVVREAVSNAVRHGRATRDRRSGQGGQRSAHRGDRQRPRHHRPRHRKRSGESAQPGPRLRRRSVRAIRARRRHRTAVVGSAALVGTYGPVVGRGRRRKISWCPRYLLIAAPFERHSHWRSVRRRYTTRNPGDGGRASRSVQLYVQRSLQLLHADPDGRDLMVSCGAVLHHAIVAFAALGWQANVHRFPDPAQPDHLATIELHRCAPDQRRHRIGRGDSPAAHRSAPFQCLARRRRRYRVDGFACRPPRHRTAPGRPRGGVQSPTAEICFAACPRCRLY